MKELIKLSRALLMRKQASSISMLAAQRLVNRGIQLCKEYIGVLLKAVKKICEIDIKTHNNFGEGVHSVCSEPFIMNLLIIMIYPTRAA